MDTSYRLTLGFTGCSGAVPHAAISTLWLPFAMVGRSKTVLPQSRTGRDGAPFRSPRVSGSASPRLTTAATLGTMLTLTSLTLHGVNRLGWRWLAAPSPRLTGGLLCLLGVAALLHHP